MTKEDLIKFCDPDSHFPIRQPFSRGNFTYATDGRLLIRVKKLDDVQEVYGSPYAEKIWPKGSYNYFEIPQFPTPSFQSCSVCHGTGEFKYEDEDDDGNKSYKIGECYNCEGDQQFPVIDKIKIGISTFSNHLLFKIKDLPSIEIAPTGVLKPAMLRFSGGDGLLMPMKE